MFTIEDAIEQAPAKPEPKRYVPEQFRPLICSGTLTTAEGRVAAGVTERRAEKFRQIIVGRQNAVQAAAADKADLQGRQAAFDTEAQKYETELLLFAETFPEFMSQYQNLSRSGRATAGNRPWRDNDKACSFKKPSPPGGGELQRFSDACRGCAYPDSGLVATPGVQDFGAENAPN